MRKLIIMLAMAAFSFMPTLAPASVSIAVHVVQYPTLQRIPGYPVYYAPRLHANYFFYDGLYWVYVDDAWYVSPWFDGPWDLVAFDSVPLFILRIPVRYYLYPPVIFSGWARNAPPRWDRVWGPDWAHRHPSWQRWNRAATPAPAPLPRYQQRFTRDNYPTDVQRRELAQQHYRYKPHDSQARETWQAHMGNASHQDYKPSSPPRQSRAEIQSRPSNAQDKDMRPTAREHANRDRPSPHREAPVARYERPPARAEAPHGDAMMHRGQSDVRESSRNAEPKHEGRPEKHGRPDKEEGHGNGKRH